MGPVRLYSFTLRVGTRTSPLIAGKRHIQVHRYKDFSDMKYVMLLMVAYARLNPQVKWSHEALCRLMVTLKGSFTQK